MAWAFETSKSIPSDTPPLTKPRVLTLPKHFHQPGTKCSNIQACGSHSHLNCYGDRARISCKPKQMSFSRKRAPWIHKGSAKVLGYLQTLLGQSCCLALKFLIHMATLIWLRTHSLVHDLTGSSQKRRNSSLFAAKGPEAQRTPMAHQGHLTEGCLYKERRTMAQSIGGYNPCLSALCLLAPWKGRGVAEWHGGQTAHLMATRKGWKSQRRSVPFRDTSPVVCLP